MNEDFFAKRYIAKSRRLNHIWTALSLCLYCHPARVESTPDCRATSQLPQHTSVQRLTALYRLTKPSRPVGCRELCEQGCGPGLSFPTPFSPLPFQCCFTCTETIRLRLVKDREPRTSTSTFTQLLSSDPYSILPLSVISHMISVSVKQHERKSRLCSTLQASFSGGWIS